MKKYIVPGSLALMFVAVCVTFFWPLSFARVIPAHSVIHVTFADFHWRPVVGFFGDAITHTNYKVEPDHPLHEEIRQVFNRYKYRRIPRTFTSNGFSGPVLDGYTLNIYAFSPDGTLIDDSFMNSLHMQGIARISVNSKTHRLYGGQRAVQTLMRKIRTLIEESEVIEPWEW